MRITLKVAAAGGVYMGRFPHIPTNIEDWKTEDDKLDIAKIRSDLRVFEDFIQFSNKDNRRTIAVTVEFLRQMCATFAKAVEDPTTIARNTPEKAVDKSLVRKMAKEQYGYVRFDIDEVGPKLRVRVGVSNPKGVVGNVIKNAKDFATDCARVLLYLQEELKKNVEVILQGREGCEDIFEIAKERDRRSAARKVVEDLNRMRVTCSNRVGDYCSPSKPSCRCYLGGKCVAQEFKEVE